MPDQPEPKGLTESMLDLLESNFDGHASEYVYDRCGEALCEQQDVRSLIAMARLSLTLQRRAEEAERELTAARAEVERLKALLANARELLKDAREPLGLVNYGMDGDE